MQAELFSVFMSLVWGACLIPYTMYRRRKGGIILDVGKTPVCKVGRRKERRGVQAPKPMHPALKLLAAYHIPLLWVLFALICWQAWMSLAALKPFDPYATLGVAPDASNIKIRQAYRSLSLKYHPDKNPDPKAAQYFAKEITKAYAILTDPKKFQNWKEYGDERGPQNYKESVALPSWMLGKGGPLSKLVMLLLPSAAVILPLTWAINYLSQYDDLAKV